MMRALLRAVFVASLAIALLGGVAVVLVQSGGMVAGDGGVVDGVNGTFKTVLCVSASVSAVAAYVLAQLPEPDAEAAEEER